MKGKAKPTEFRGQRRPSAAAAAVAAAGGTRPRVHPASTSIYWESVDSSGGSSGSGSRNYVDPWDLENYAYLRRHSIAVASPQPVYQASRNHGYSGRLSNHSPLLESDDYWYASAIREPGYDAPASVEEIYFRPPRPVSNGYYYQQPTYEDDESHYTAPVPLYTRLSEIEQAEALEELRTREMLRRRSKAIPGPMDYPRPREECYYHRRPSALLRTEVHPRRRGTRALEAGRAYDDEEVEMEVEVEMEDEEEEEEEEVIVSIGRDGMEEEEEEEETPVDEADEGIRYKSKSSHMTLSTYGHLKIDYTNSWNSLHRKIVSK